MEKMTNKVALQFVLGLQEVKENVEVYEKMKKMLEQVEKKSSSTKQTKTQIENEMLKNGIARAIAEKEVPIQIKELLPEFEGMTNQKMSALLKQLVEEGRVQKVIEKRVSKFYKE